MTQERPHPHQGLGIDNVNNNVVSIMTRQAFYSVRQVQILLFETIDFLRMNHTAETKTWLGLTSSHNAVNGKGRKGSARSYQLEFSWSAFLGFYRDLYKLNQVAVQGDVRSDR
jgi:hypothetical protein